MSVDFKQRYKELKSKTLEATNLAYRLGMEAGLQQAAMENAQMQVQQMQQQQMAMQGQQVDPATGQPIQGGQEQAVDENGQPVDPSMQGQPMSPEDQMAMQGQQGDPMAEEMPEGQGTELDMYINELEELVSKGQKPTISDLRKTVTALSDLRKTQKIKMKENKPQIISAQKSMVDSILKSWAKESGLTADNLEERIKEEGLKL